MTSALSPVKLYLEKDWEVIVESKPFTAADYTPAPLPVIGSQPTPFVTITLLFSKVVQNLHGNPSNKVIEGFGAVDEIFQEYTRRDASRKFASISLNLYTLWENNTWTKAYYAEFNENVLKHLCTTNFHKVRVDLRSVVEDYRLGKWCKWNNLEFLHNFQLSFRQANWAVYDEQQLTTKLSLVNNEESGIVDLIRAGKQNLRIRLKIDIWLERNDMQQIASNPMKLSDPCLVLKTMYENNTTKDVKIVFGDGVELKAHKCVLAAHSKVFERMLSSKMEEGTFGVIPIEDMSAAGMTELLRYCYGMEISTLDLKCETAFELLHAAHKYNLVQLEEAVVSLLLSRDEEWYSTDTLLELYYYTGNMPDSETLNQHLFKILSTTSSEKLRGSEKFQKLSPSAGMDLILKLRDSLRLV